MHRRRKTAFALAALAGLLVALPTVQAQPAGFAPAGSRATLTVEYRYEASGRKQNKYDSWQWQVMRRVELEAELVAGKPQSLPSMQPLDAGHSARQQQQMAQAQRATTEMAPMMASAQAVIEKCGDDDKCIEREAMRMGMAMAGTPQQAQAQRTARETAEVMKPGADRYQVWSALTQKGSYALDESWKVVHADPICMRLPGARCKHDLLRKGGGALAASASPSNLEFDLQAGTVMLMLPVPLAPLNYVETHTTDEPEGAHDTATPRGPQNGQTLLRVTADGKVNAPPLKVALKGGWRSQAGEQVITMPAGAWHGGGGDDGRLVVRWKFTAQ